MPKKLPSKDLKGYYISKKEPNLILIDKENGGKADSLNAAINHSQYPLLCCVDADSLIDEAGLIRIAFPFFDKPETIAAGSVYSNPQWCHN